jgi:uracil-DNA glycosylase family 4
MSILQRENILFEKMADALSNEGWSDDKITFMLSTIHRDIVSSMPNISLDDLEKFVISCRACYGKGLVTEHGPITGRGRKGIPIDILFVGIMPGSTEEKTGKVFTGPNSEVLMNNLKELGMGGNDCPTYAHNLVCCMPTGSQPKVEQIKNCSPFLAELIYILQPNIIVTLGTTALSFMLGKSVKLQDYEGQVLMQGRYIVIPLKHPSALHRIPEDKKADKKEAFAKYREQLAGVKRVNQRIKDLREKGEVPQRGEFFAAWEDREPEQEHDVQQSMC